MAERETKKETRDKETGEEESVLRGQVAVVTGASRGIGAEVARRLARMGANVVLTARNQALLAEVEANIREAGGKATAIPCDLIDAEAIAAFGERIAREFGRLDILVNNAGIGILGKSLLELAPEDWNRTMATNLRAPYLMIRALAPLMVAARSGFILNISSLAGKNPLPNGAAYSASKWGLNGLTYSVAEELRQSNVRVAVIAPGSVDTSSVDTSFDTGRDAKKSKDPSKNRAKMLRPSDVAHVVAAIVTQAPNSFVSEVLLRPAVKP